MEFCHITIATVGRQPLLATEEAMRRFIHALARSLGGRLVTFGVADDHVHLVVACPRDAAGPLAAAIQLALRALAATPTLPAHFEPVRTRRHLSNLAGYCIEQPARHGLPDHPALWTGSAFPDLVGARVVPGLDLRLFEVLPRLRPADLCRAAGLDVRSIDPMPLDGIRRHGALALVSAAGAALAAPPDLRGREQSAVSARIAAVRVGRAVGIASEEIRSALGTSARAVRRLARLPTTRPILDAVRRRLTLEEIVNGAVTHA